MTETTCAMLGLPAEAITNPYDVPDELDAVLPLPADVPSYSETIALSTWSPDDGVGVFVHAGRCPQDLDLWWAQVAVYLPGGLVAASRTWGRCPEGTGLRTGSLDLRMPGAAHGGWSAMFDGAAEIVPWTAMLERPTGAGRARPVRWDLQTAPAGPVWDMYGAMGRGGRQDWASGMHTQQVVAVQGTLIVDGQRHRLDGVGWKDHSAGARDMSGFGRDHFLGGSLPGGALHCLSVFSLDGTPLMEAGTLLTADGSTRTAVLTGVPLLADLDSAESEFDAALVDGEGNRSSVHVEVLATFPMAISDDNDNINGIDWTGSDVLTLLESRVRLTTADGAVGYAHLERGARRHLLTRVPHTGGGC